jgi:hypothetical protein
MVYRRGAIKTMMYLIFSAIVIMIVAAWSIRQEQDKEDKALDEYLKRRIK